MKQQGFHLLEILITLAIISILSAITMPLYSSHLSNARRLQAETKLLKMMVAIENYYVMYHSYQAIPADILKNENDENYHYQFIPNDQHYKVIATPIGVQAARDVKCGAISINDQNEKNISGTNSVNDCW